MATQDMIMEVDGVMITTTLDHDVLNLDMEMHPKDANGQAKQGDAESDYEGQGKDFDNANRKRKRSIVWEHLHRLKCKDGEVPMAQCRYCKKKFPCDSIKNGTGNMLKHLRYKCPKAPDSVKMVDPKQKILTQTLGGVSSIAYSGEGCRVALAQMVIIDELPFRFVEGEGFKKFCKAMQPKFSIPSRATLTRDCLRLFNEEKDRIRRELQGHMICITTDTWTSVQNMNYMCLTAHFIDTDSHKGESLGKAIEQCLIEWGVESLFTVTVDNASSNNGAIAHLKKRTRGWKDVILGHEFLHMRCCAHILNLVVCDGLKETCESIEKIRNSIRYVRSSPSRLAAFKKSAEKQKVSTKGLLCLDVPTRWNSTYLMLESALKYQKAFEQLEEDDVTYKLYFMDDDKNKSKDENLESDRKTKRAGPPEAVDFDTAAILVRFLKLFYEATLKFSGSTFVTSNACYVELALIENKINMLASSGDALLSFMAKSMKVKYDKYWGNKSRTNMLLYIEVVLDPRKKIEWLRFCFDKLMDDVASLEMLTTVKDALKRLYEWFATHGSSVSHGESSQSRQSNSEAIMDEVAFDANALEAEFNLKMMEESMSGSKTELDQYLLEPCLQCSKDFTILNWWKQNSCRYSTLSQLARNVLAVPVSTVASESCFSTGGRILDPFRSSLSPPNVEALICAQNWIKSPSKGINTREVMDYIATIDELGTDLHLEC